MAKSQIFICYRRQDSEDIAGRLYERLARDFGPDGVFMDIDDIPLAVDFREHIRRALVDSDFLLALIGPRWVELLNKRTEDLRDYLRVELETAEAMGIAIAPILLKDAANLQPKDLPEGFAPREKLLFNQSRPLRSGADFDSDYRNLAKAIKKAREHKAGTVTTRKRRPGALIAVAFMALVLLGLAGFYGPKLLDWVRPPVRHALTIATDVAGVRVSVDGEDRGAARRMELAPGPHRLRITADGYAPYERTVDIDGDVEIKPRLKVLRYSLVVRSNVRDDQVFIDGEPKGETPLNMELAFGEHTVRITKKGYEAYEKSFKLTAPKEIKGNLARESYALTIATDVVGARLSVDGEDHGTMRRMVLAPGSHRLRITADGYAPYERTVDIDGDVEIKPRLKVLRYSLIVRSNVRDDQVFIDGEPKGETPLNTELAFGEHTVRITKKGYEAYEKSFKLTAPKEIKGNLARLYDARVPVVGKPFRDSLKSGGEGPEMVVLPAGAFQMGSPEGEKGRNSDEGPRHRVTVAAFALGRTETTYEDYDRFAQATGRTLPKDRGWGRGNRPVINVIWEDAGAYAEWLSAQTGAAYRLPSEAEWEYAARAGSRTSYWWGDEIRRGSEVMANCDGCGSEWDDKQTAPVASFPANPFGLHDLHGNVWEWTQDCWHATYENAPTDAVPWLQASEGNCARHVVRGGSWNYRAVRARSAYRNRNDTGGAFLTIGFRLARIL